MHIYYSIRTCLLIILLFFSHSLLSQHFVKNTFNNSTGTKSENYRSFTENGAWCWFSDPRAVYYEGRFKRTYAGWIDSNGNVTIGYYDHSGGEIKTAILRDTFQKDDHDNPALLFAPDGRLMVFFTRHGDPGPTFLFTMKNPEDIGCWNEQVLYLNDMDFYKGFNNTNTYVNPVMLTEENNRIYLFWRGVDNKPNYSFSDDLGKTWSKGRIFVLPERIYEMRRPYMKVESNGKDKIMFAFTDGHPNAEKENSIYSMFYKNGNLYNAKGEKIGILSEDPVNPRKASVVYDASITKQKAWIWDIAMDKHENPVIVYVKFPDNMNHIYCYSKWNGRKWKTYDLVNSGGCFPEDKVPEQNYSGGLVLDHENPDILYLSVKREPTFEIEKWVIIKGRKWTTEAITEQSGKDNVRPIAVRNSYKDNPLQFLWMQNNHYIHYTDYSSSVKMNILP